MNNRTCPADTAATRNQVENPQTPRFSTFEDKDGITLHVALPAVAKQDLKLTLLESNLRIEGRRNHPVPESWKTLREGNTLQNYRLDVRLTARFDGTRATALLDAGVLTLRIPIREEAKPRKIEVN